MIDNTVELKSYTQNLEELTDVLIKAYYKSDHHIIRQTIQKIIRLKSYNNG